MNLEGNDQKGDVCNAVHSYILPSPEIQWTLSTRLTELIEQFLIDSKAIADSSVVFIGNKLNANSYQNEKILH